MIFWWLLGYVIGGTITVFLFDFYFEEQGMSPENGREVMYIFWGWPLLAILQVVSSIIYLVRNLK